MKNVKYLIILALSLFSLQAYSQGYKIVLKDGRAASVRADITKVITFSQSANTKAGAVPGYEISLKDGRSVVIGVDETESFTFSTDASLMTDISALEEPEHEYVDLGLSVKWATMNVGATEVAGSKINAHTGQLDCYGEYYAWGETSPKDSYDWSNLKYCNGTTFSGPFTKYVIYSNEGTLDNKMILEPEDDAATANWGEGWRMPTYIEQGELLKNCYWEWTENYNNSGVKGYIVYKVKDDSDKNKHPYYDYATSSYITPAPPTASYSLSDTHIFLPATGYCKGSDFVEVNSRGCYWTSSILGLGSGGACNNYFNSQDAENTALEGTYRFLGLTVRPVYLSPSDVVAVSSISLSSTSLSMTEGDQESLTANISPSDATNKYIIWTSSDVSVAEVSTRGIITAVSAGSATITATAADGSGVKATCTVTVEAQASAEPEAVDLGLSVKWANMNVGATEVAGSKINAHTGQLACYGEYYAWGETSPKDSYDWSTYKYCTNYDTESYTFTFSKYITNSEYGTIDNKAILDPEDDAATANWGEGWRMPTDAEIEELYGNCYCVWTTNYNNTGITGYIIYKAKDASDKGKHADWDPALGAYTSPDPAASYSLSDAHIFLPAAGFRRGSYVYATGESGSYSSKSLLTFYDFMSFSLNFELNSIQRAGADRCNGRTIRPVYLSPSDVVAVSSIALSSTSLSMTEGDTETLSATVSPSNATNKGITWTSSNESVAKVSSLGVVTAVSAGSATITATAADGSGVKATCSVTVEALAPAEPEAVDLGLSVKWANMNVGATEVAGSKINAHTGQLDCYGEYYAWGETSPKDSYSWETYTLCNGSKTSMTKYCTNSSYGTVDNKRVLDPEDDAATANWGEGWRMPTIAEQDELRTQCTWIWTTMNGVNGYKVTGTNGNSIFLPAAGYRDDGSFRNVGSNGSYWSSVRYSDYSVRPYCLYFISNIIDYDSQERYRGFTIRPVYSSPSDAVSVSSISFSNSSISMTEGFTQTLTATVTPSDATNQGITWTSSNESVAKVSNSGAVTAVSIGTATITATAADGSGVKATCNVTVVAKISAEQEAVDLGLSVKWANMNVGATEVAGSKINAHTGKPDCYGEYYAWGETSPKDSYDWSNLKYCDGTTSEGPFTKYIAHSDKTVLDPEDDAATVNWGDNWRMPTSAEQKELKDQCTWTWTNLNGVNGYKVTGPNGNYIFLPAAGFRYGSEFDDWNGSNGYYWSNTLYYTSDRADFLSYNSYTNEIGTTNFDRNAGFPVRPVYSDPYNGHEYVDLGVSVKWATMNVGATEVAGSKTNSHTGQLDCYGEYYAWGETTPKDSYGLSNYKYSADDDNAYTKYVTSSEWGTVDNKTVLDSEDDAATANWGGKWRTPSQAEQQELLDNCYWVYTASYNNSGVKGFIVYKAKDASDKGKYPTYDEASDSFVTPAAPVASYSLSDAHIFLPAAGLRKDSDFEDVTSCGYYWSSSLCQSTTYSAFMTYLYESNCILPLEENRDKGRSVRAVCP